MFCKNCGTKINDDACFCANCGAKTATDESGVLPPLDDAVADRQDGAIPNAQDHDERSVFLFIGCVLLYTLSFVDFALSWYGIDITGFHYSPYIFGGLGALCQYLRKTFYGEQKFGKFETYAIGIIASIGVVAAVIGGACFREPSTRDVEKQSVELLKGALDEHDELSKYVKVEKVENVSLFKREKNHYSGTAYVWLQRKTNPSKHAVRFKYEITVTLSSDGALLECNASDADSLAEYISPSDEDAGDSEIEAVDGEDGEASNSEDNSVSIEDGEKVMREQQEVQKGGYTSVEVAAKASVSSEKYQAMFKMAQMYQKQGLTLLLNAVENPSSDLEAMAKSSSESLVRSVGIYRDLIKDIDGALANNASAEDERKCKMIREAASYLVGDCLRSISRPASKLDGYRVDAIKCFETYLRTYPNGKYVKPAMEKIEAIRKLRAGE